MERKNTADIEVLTLMMGFERASRLTGIPEETLRDMLGQLRPENHAFFGFFRDTLIKCVRTMGAQRAAGRLHVSVEVLELIEKHEHPT